MSVFFNRLKYFKKDKYYLVTLAHLRYKKTKKSRLMFDISQIKIIYQFSITGRNLYFVFTMSTFQNMFLRPKRKECDRHNPDNVFKRFKMIGFPISFVGLSTSNTLDVEVDLTVSAYLKTLYDSQLLVIFKYLHYYLSFILDDNVVKNVFFFLFRNSMTLAKYQLHIVRSKCLQWITTQSQ